MKRSLLFILIVFPLFMQAQNGCTGVDAGPDVVICTGGSVQLSASGGFNYAWTPAYALSDTSIYNPVASPTVTTTYYVSALVAQPDTNLIINPDFEQGNTGFSSGYTYAANMFPSGTYNVGSNPNSYNGNFSTCGDHTSGSGMMAIFNGTTNTGVNVWCQSVAVTPNTNYIFSFWMCKVFNGTGAQLQLSINGAANLVPFTITAATCVWTKFSTIWNSASNTTASLCLTDLVTVGFGNDFALDDLSFSPTCTATDSVTVFVHADSLTAHAGPDTTICAGQTVTLTASGGSVYQWSNGAGSTASVNVSPATTTTYTVTVSSPGCSSSTDSATVTVLPNPLPVITQAGDTLHCTVSPPGMSYQWYFNNTLIAGATDSIYVITQNGTYSCTVSNSNGCSRSAGRAVTLVVPTAKFTYIGPACTNHCFDFVNLSVNATSYRWQFPGATPTVDSSVNPKNICYIHPGTYTAVLTAYNTGTNNVITGQVVVYAAPPVPTVTQSNDTLYCSTNAAYISYQWYYNNTLIPGATGTYLVVTQNGDYSVTVTDAHGCSQTVVKTVGLALPKAGFTAVNHMCVNSCIDFTNLSQNATSYKWSFPGGTPASDTAANPHNICYNSPGNYTVTLIAFNGALSDTLTLTNYITIYAPPPVPTITQSGDTLYSSTDPSYTIYQWYLNNTLLPGAVNSFLVISQSGTYKVVVTDANGCTSSDTIDAVLVLPTAGFTSVTHVCENSCVDFTNLSLNARSYQWFFAGAQPPSDTSANPKNICYTTAGLYEVTLVATNSGGSDTLKQISYMRVYAAPHTPTITLVGSTLYCTTDPTYTSYQWYKDAVLIPGATDTLLVITQSGNYNVQVTNENGCQIAVGINVILTGTVAFAPPPGKFYIYPNPAGEQLTISNWQLATGQLIIYNMLGEEVYFPKQEIRNNKQETIIDISSLPPGIYFIRLSDISGSYMGTTRFVKE